MNCVRLVSLGPVEPCVMAAVEVCLAGTYGMTVRRLAWDAEPAHAWDAARGQFNSALILQELLRRAPRDAVRTLAVTEGDLCLPVLTFVFGQAQLGGTAAIFSLARLRPEFYGFPADRDLLVERALRETLHEMGHTFNLRHCSGPFCAMALSTGIRQLDSRAGVYCPGCAALLDEALATARGDVQSSVYTRTS